MACVTKGNTSHLRRNRKNTKNTIFFLQNISSIMTKIPLIVQYVHKRYDNERILLSKFYFLSQYCFIHISNSMQVLSCQKRELSLQKRHKESILNPSIDYEWTAYTAFNTYTDSPLLMNRCFLVQEKYRPGSYAPESTSPSSDSSKR